MRIEVALKDRRFLQPLFEGISDTAVLSCIQGYLGKTWCDNRESPKVASALCGHYAYLGGDPNIPEAREFVENLPDHSVVIPASAAWAPLIEQVHGSNATRAMRYATRVEKEFDQKRLEAIAHALPEGYVLRRFDERLAEKALQNPWSWDFTGQFETPENFVQNGMGWAVLFGEELVSGATTFAVCDTGIEIQIITREDHRRRGLALSASAALILESLSKGLYPNWDATTMISIQVAQKLGYSYGGEYLSYVIDYGENNR